VSADGQCTCIDFRTIATIFFRPERSSSLRCFYRR
jgi:hypothetical protein